MALSSGRSDLKVLALAQEPIRARMVGPGTGSRCGRQTTTRPLIGALLRSGRERQVRAVERRFVARERPAVAGQGLLSVRGSGIAPNRTSNRIAIGHAGPSCRSLSFG